MKGNDRAIVLGDDPTIDLVDLPGWVEPAIPAGWRLLEARQEWRHYERILTRESVILSAGKHSDGRRWLHFSVAHPSRIPNHQELARYKGWFIGDDRKAIHVFPPRSEHVNIHPYCLHLFSCFDTDPLPDFTAGSGTL